MYLLAEVWKIVPKILLLGLARSEPELSEVQGSSYTRKPDNDLFQPEIIDKLNNLSNTGLTYREFYKNRILETYSWKNAAVKLGQCPCVTMSTSSACIGYDSTMFANSLREAVRNFRRPAQILDLYLGHPNDETVAGSPAPVVGNFAPNQPAPQFSQTSNPDKVLPDLGVPLGALVECKEERCRQCAKLILRELLSQTNNIVNGNYKQEVMDEIKAMEEEFQTTNSTRSYCPDLDTSWSRHPSSGNLDGNAGFLDSTRPVPSNRISAAEMRRITKAIRRQGPDFHTHTKRSVETGDIKFQKRDIRIKRQVQAIEKQFETVYKIDCKQRGDPVEKGSVFLNLCNHCWEWGYLPENFYPRYVNMITCQPDTRCLSGWGTCGQRTRAVQVLQNTAAPGDPPQYKPYSLNIPVFCDCQVKAGTALHDFVRG